MKLFSHPDFFSPAEGASSNAGMATRFPFSHWSQAVLRSIAAFLICGVCFFTVVGCGGTGGEAEFTPTEALSEEEQNYAEEYEKQQQENQKRMREGY
jgi:hypothetical protein